HDLADGGPLLRGDLDEVEVGLARHLQRLGGRDQAELLPLGADQPDGADADLLVDPLVPFLRWCVTVGWWNALDSFVVRGHTLLGPRSGREPHAPHGARARPGGSTTSSPVDVSRQAAGRAVRPDVRQTRREWFC